MWKYLLKGKVMVVTASIFALFAVVSLVPWSRFEIANPFSVALEDFELTDMVFSRGTQLMDHESLPVDTNIVIVNIGRSNRAEMAQIIRHISRYQPAVIGIDALYRSEKDPEMDSLMAAALQDAGCPVVMVSDLRDRDSATGRFTTVATSNPKFAQYTDEGYANITNESALRTVRQISPRQVLASGDTAYSFGVQLLKHYRPEAAQAVLARDREQERINWRGHFEKFFLVEYDAALDTTVDLSYAIQGRIVLMAYVDVSTDPRLRSLEDLYFSPLNEQYAGKGLPDLYGIYVHANFISMCLQGDFIEVMPEWQGYLWAAILCYINVAFFTWIFTDKPRWFDVAAVSTQFVLNVLVLFLVVLIFTKYRYEIQINTIVAVLFLGPTIIELLLPLWEQVDDRLRGRKPVTSLPAAAAVQPSATSTVSPHA